MLRIGLDSEIEDLEQHFETAHLNYLQTTDQRTHDFKYYTKKDQDIKEIEIKIRKTSTGKSTSRRTKLTQNTERVHNGMRFSCSKKIKFCTIFNSSRCE